MTGDAAAGDAAGQDTVGQDTVGRDIAGGDIARGDIASGSAPLVFGIVRFADADGRRIIDTIIMFESPESADSYARGQGWVHYAVTGVRFFLDLPVRPPEGSRLFLDTIQRRLAGRPPAPPPRPPSPNLPPGDQSSGDQSSGDPLSGGQAAADGPSSEPPSPPDPDSRPPPRSASFRVHQVRRHHETAAVGYGSAQIPGGGA